MEVNYFDHIFKWLRLAGRELKPEPVLPEFWEFELWRKLMLEELEETRLAFEKKDLSALVDGIVDLQWVHANMILMAGLQDRYDEFFQKVADSNFSKFCKTEDEARKSVEFYKTERNIEAHYEKVGEYFILLRNSDGKILKSVNWKEPEINL